MSLRASVVPARLVARFACASALVAPLALAGCGGTGVAEEDPSSSQAAATTTTVTLLAATTLAKGASKTGFYTATVAGPLTFKTTGTGDADLYVKKGAAASPTTKDCASETSTAVERCVVTVAVGDKVYWDVFAYAASTVSLTVDVPAATPPPPATTTIALFPTTSIAKGTHKSGRYVATVAGSIKFATTGTGDADLYVKKGVAASLTVHDCAAETSSASEQCALTVAVGDSIYWDVYGYAASSVKLDLTVPAGGTPAAPTALPPGMQYCAVAGACGTPSSKVNVCADGQTSCAPTRTTDVAWTVNGLPVSTLGINFTGGATGVNPTVPTPGNVRLYFPFVIGAGISHVQVASSLDISISYYGAAPVWGGTTALDFTGTTQTAPHGTSMLYRWPTYDLGVTHAALSTSIEKIASDEIAATGITPPLYQAFFLPTEIAVPQGIDAGLAFGDGVVQINYGNPGWIASTPGGAAAIMTHEFAHENAHTLFAQIASKFSYDPSCLNEGLADGLGNYLGYISDADLQKTGDGSDVTHACTALTEVHARGKCVLWHLKSAGYFQPATWKGLFTPQHTFAFSSCDMSAAATGNGYVVYLTEATGADMGALVSSMGWPNAGSYAAAKAALGL
jgi:hypothetical protein